MDRTNYGHHRVTALPESCPCRAVRARRAASAHTAAEASQGTRWRYFGQDSSCQATWRQTSDRQSTAVSPVRPLANRYLTVPFCPRSRFIIIYCDTVTLITQFISLETLLFLRLASACRRGEATRCECRDRRPQPVTRSIRSRVTAVQRCRRRRLLMLRRNARIHTYIQKIWRVKANQTFMPVSTNVDYL